MRIFSLILLFLFFKTTPSSGQVHIEGRVLDNATSQPLPGASVYINHTTIGTVTNAEGYFALPGLDSGNYELVISYVGYERIIYNMQVRSRDLRLIFRMDSRVDEMREIMVVGPALRKLWLEIFRHEFLGRTAAAEEAIIRNEEDIFFTNSGDAELISAFTDVPLVVENKALGYMIYFELHSFSYHRKTGKSSFWGYNRFEEIKEEDGDAGKYSTARLSAYKGSTMHFFRSLKNNRFREEGFSILGVQQAAKSRKSETREQASDAALGPEVFLPGNTYPASRKTILFLDTSTQRNYLQWKDALQVTYLPTSEIPVGLTQTGVTGQGPRGQVSYIFIVEPPVFIHHDGMPVDPQSVRFGGIWHSERVANMLPLDYDPRRRSVLNKKRF